MSHDRRGSEALEFAITTPLILALFSLIVDFGWFASHQGSVYAAAADGARAASMTPLEEDPLGAARLHAERTLLDAEISGANVVVSETSLSNGELAVRVEIDAPYSGLWGYFPMDIDHHGIAVMRMGEQPLKE